MALPFFLDQVYVFPVIKLPIFLPSARQFLNHKPILVFFFILTTAGSVLCQTAVVYDYWEAASIRISARVQSFLKSKH